MGGRLPGGEPKKSAPGWVGDYQGPARAGAHNAIIADLAMPVVSAPRGGRTWLRGVLVVGDRRKAAILEPLLPAPGSTAGRGGRPEKHCRRVIVDAILYIVRGGIAWRQLPVEFASAGTGTRCSPGGPAAGRGSASSTRCATDCGCGPGSRCPTAAIIDSQTVPAADTVPDPAAAGMAAREMVGSDLVKLAHFQVVRQDQFEAALGAGGGLAAELFDGLHEGAVEASARLQFEETAVGAALFLQIAEGRDVAVLEDQHLVAALLHIAQEMRGEDQVQVSAVADFLNQRDHAQARRGIESIGGLVEKEHLGTVHDGLGQFGGLLHAQRIGAERAVTNFTETHVEERFVRAFQGVLGRQAGEFGHQADEAHAAHRRDEGIILRHVADQAAHFAYLRAYVFAEDARGAGGRLVKAEQGVDQGALARAVRSRAGRWIAP